MSDKIINKNITNEMQSSFLDYAMSVIVSRALPDVRDGLKPVHRRILFAMSELNNTADKPYKKSARIVGDVIGKYHPHGDTSVYDAMVRMAQDFSYRDELVDGHGNFGSIDGDGAAAMRYTEARMSKIAMELLRDINKGTIDYQENYDGSEMEPVVLPSKFPNLLVNGASGIAVGMATNIPPHNLEEVIDAAIALIDNEDITITELMEFVKGPDFPLGAQILGVSGIEKAYHSGNGSIRVRSKYEIVDTPNGKPRIVVTEIPYQVNKSMLVEKIATQAKNKVIDGITDIRDESDKDGIRVVIELRRDVNTDVVINNLFKHTQLEVSYSFNMLALVKGQPKVLNLKDILANYLDHQREVIVRRTKYDMEKAERRAHILQGLKIAVDNIDEVIELIRESKTTEEAREKLIARFELSDEQTKAILEMRLQKLTGLERDKIEVELNELLTLIAELREILADSKKVDAIVKDELTEIRVKYGSERRTKIVYDYVENDSDYERLIDEKDVLITLTKEGYIKRMDVRDIKSQNRGGKGSRGIALNSEDEVSKILFASTHSDLLFFTDGGKVFKTRTHKVPEYASRSVKGLPLINLIDIDKNDKITSIISLKEYDDDKYLFFTTKAGIAKKTSLSEYSRINKNGKIAIKIDEDSVIDVEVIDDKDEIFLATSAGLAIKTTADQFRPLGRTARGVRGIKLKAEDDFVIGSGIVKEGDGIVSVTEKGYGKITSASEYRLQSRAGSGTKNLKVTEKTGCVKKIEVVNEKELENRDLIILTQNGQSIRTPLSTLRFMGRNTQGVKLIDLRDNDKVTALEIVENDEVTMEEVIENGEN